MSIQLLCEHHSGRIGLLDVIEWLWTTSSWWECWSFCGSLSANSWYQWCRSSAGQHWPSTSLIPTVSGARVCWMCISGVSLPPCSFPLRLSCHLFCHILLTPQSITQISFLIRKKHYSKRWRNQTRHLSLISFGNDAFNSKFRRLSFLSHCWILNASDNSW